MRTCGSTHAHRPPSRRMLPSAPYPCRLPARPYPENLNHRGVYHSFTSQSKRERGKIAIRLVKKQLTHFSLRMDPQACNQPFCTCKAILARCYFMQPACVGDQTDGSCLQAAPIGSSQCPTQGATYLPLVATPMRSSSCCLCPPSPMAWNRLPEQHLEIMAELQRGIQPWHIWAEHMTLSSPVSIPNLHLWPRAALMGWFEENRLKTFKGSKHASTLS